MKSLIITPDGVITDNNTRDQPENIHLVLPSGAVYDIADVVDVMVAHEKATTKKKGFKFVRKGKRFVSAVKQAMNDMDEPAPAPGPVNEPTVSMEPKAT